MGNTLSSTPSENHGLFYVILVFVVISFLFTQTPPPPPPPTMGPSTQPLTGPSTTTTPPPPPTTPPPPTKSNGGFAAYMWNLYNTGQLPYQFFKNLFPDAYQAGRITYNDYLADRNLPPQYQPTDYKSIYKQNYGFEHQQSITSIIMKDDVSQQQAATIFYNDEEKNIENQLGPYYTAYRQQQ